jgi:hypothetical protein
LIIELSNQSNEVLHEPQASQGNEFVTKKVAPNNGKPTGQTRHAEKGNPTGRKEKTLWGGTR